MIDTNETSDDTDRTATHRIRHNPATDSNLCATLVVALAEIADADPMDLDPLYETVDPETLDDMVASGGAADLDGNVTFTYEGHHVRVHASGLIEIAAAVG